MHVSNGGRSAPNFQKTNPQPFQHGGTLCFFKVRHVIHSLRSRTWPTGLRHGPCWSRCAAQWCKARMERKGFRIGFRYVYGSFWSNYSDLTRPHPKWWFSKGNPLISGKSRLVKYYNLPRSFSQIVCKTNHLGNIGKYHFLGNCGWFFGVKLMELNSNGCFPASSIFCFHLNPAHSDCNSKFHDG